MLVSNCCLQVSSFWRSVTPATTKHAILSREANAARRSRPTLFCTVWARRSGYRSRFWPGVWLLRFRPSRKAWAPSWRLGSCLGMYHNQHHKAIAALTWLQFYGSWLHSRLPLCNHDLVQDQRDERSFRHLLLRQLLCAGGFRSDRLRRSSHARGCWSSRVAVAVHRKSSSRHKFCMMWLTHAI